ncbi:MAG: tRNA lysidine(34) synthetase TilS [Puniceicoccales bacterium]|jgi:tRNA(Ile)-lysidine synthetase-like protein|nr:tRNA lysidine(34) synthetase TilS [Puniceicoccales bacterium]
MMGRVDDVWQEFARVVDREIGARLGIFPAISPNDRLCIACSGGIDSVCLALALAAKFPADRLAILYYNHNTRGRETDDDARFVSHLASALGVAFFTEKRSEGPVSEDALRAARYTFFSQIMAEIGSKFLFLAHHADDVVETMLMRLARGSAKIAAPKNCQPVRDGTRRLRPLISVFKQEIIDIFTKNRIPWREDSSNQSEGYLRNRIRKIMPLLGFIFRERDWKSGFLLAHRYLEEDASCLNQMAENLCSNPQKLDLQAVAHPAIIRRAIQRWLHDSPPTRPCFEQILTAVTQNRSAKISVKPKIFVEINGKILHKKTKFSNFFEINFKYWQWGTVYLPTGYKLTRAIVPFPPQNFPGENLNTSVIYISGENNTKIFIRARLPGDQYRPINAPTKSLKKLFSEKKIPANQRSTLPVLCDERGAILWVPHLPPADAAKVQKNYALRITFSSTEVKKSMP